VIELLVVIQYYLYIFLYLTTKKEELRRTPLKLKFKANAY